MNQLEPNAALRVIRARLFDNTGSPLPANHTFATGDLKIQKPDNTIANASALPVARANALLTGMFDIQVSQAELNQVGAYSWQLKSATTSDWEWVESVTVADTDNTTVTVGQAAAPASPFSLVQGDLEPDMPVNLVELDGTATNLTAATSIQLHWLKPDGTSATVSLTAVDLVNGMMKRVWASGDSSLVGRHRGQVVVTAANAETTTYPRNNTLYEWFVYAKIG